MHVPVATVPGPIRNRVSFLRTSLPRWRWRSGTPTARTRSSAGAERRSICSPADQKWPRADGGHSNPIQSGLRTVGQLLNPPPAHRTSPAPAPPTAAVAPPGGPVQVLNATSRAGLARRTQQALTARGFHVTGVASITAQPSSSITYGPGGQPTALALSTTLGVPDNPDPRAPAGSIRLVLGADFVLPPSTTSPAAPGAPASAVPATGTGRNAPPPTALTALPGGGIPCVK